MDDSTTNHRRHDRKPYVKPAIQEVPLRPEEAEGKGVEIHGCGLLDSYGRAYVFAGQSGAGKSTLARLVVHHPGVTLLSDERVVLRTDRDRITVFGTPWQGDAHFASPQSGELAAVFFLNKGATLRPVVLSRSVSRRRAAPVSEVTNTPVRSPAPRCRARWRGRSDVPVPH
jgi:hypothetical protein